MPGIGAKRPLSGRFDRVLALLLVLGLALIGIECVTLAFSLGLSVDEAWITQGIKSLATTGSYATHHGQGATTTGGVYALLQIVIARLSGGALPAMRLLSTLSLALLLREVYSWARSAGISRTGALISTSAVVGVPGTVILASTAYAAILATCLAVVAIRIFSGADSRRAVICAGSLFGLAAATRLNLVLVLPALLLARLLAPPCFRRPWIDTMIGVGVGSVVFVAAYALLSAAVPDLPFSLSQTSRSAGLSTLAFTWRELLTNWTIGNALTPVPLLAASTLGAYWLAARHPMLGARLAILVALGCTTCVFWWIATPHAHLRYLWPALAAFALPAGLALASLFDHPFDPRNLGSRIHGAIGAVALCLIITSALGGFRGALVGDMDLLTWEWRGVTAPALSPLDGSARQHQLEMVAVLQGLPRREPVGVLGMGYAMEVLSGRRILPITRVLTSEASARWILTTPHYRRVSFIHPRGDAWLQEHCEVKHRFGDYQLCRIEEVLPKRLSWLFQPQRKITY